MVRPVLVLTALVAAAAPLPAAAIERYYSAGLYPIWQSWVTTISNAVPIALFDVFIVGIVSAWVILAVRDGARWRARGAGRTAGRVLARTAVWAAAAYLLFFASWGLNYRR